MDGRIRGSVVDGDAPYAPGVRQNRRFGPSARPAAPKANPPDARGERGPARRPDDLYLLASTMPGIFKKIAT